MQGDRRGRRVVRTEGLCNEAPGAESPGEHPFSEPSRLDAATQAGQQGEGGPPKHVSRHVSPAPPVSLPLSLFLSR